MNKWIENMKLKIVSKMEANRKAFEEAEASYGDTGYDRYYKRMEKLDNEYEELKAFLLDGKEDNEQLLTEIKMENEALRKTLSEVKSKVYYLSKDFPRCSDLINLEDILKQY